MVTSLFLLDFFVRWMTFESTGERELSQLVANHLIGDIDRYVLLAVVHSNGQADEIGQNHRTTRPSLNRLFVFGSDSFFSFSNQMMVDKGTFF